MEQVTKGGDARGKLVLPLHARERLRVILLKPERHTFPGGVLLCVGTALGFCSHQRIAFAHSAVPGMITTRCALRS